jgi:phosphomannomutase
MHGVGTPVAKRAFEVFSFNPFISTKEQEEPDPDFLPLHFQIQRKEKVFKIINI